MTEHDWAPYRVWYPAPGLEVIEGTHHLSALLAEGELLRYVDGELVIESDHD